MIRRYLEKLSWQMERFMRGRNGMDDLARAFYYVSLVTLVLSLFVPYVGYLTLPCCIYSIFRMCSRRVDKRQRENTWYLNKTDGFRARFGRGGNRRSYSNGYGSSSAREQARKLAEQKRLRFEERHEYKFFKCKCGTTLRVRRGQGTKELSCPICHEKKMRNTN